MQAWAESLGGIDYPLLSDFYPHGKVARSYGVLQDDGRTERAIFVIDKQRIIRYVDIHDIDDLPDNEEIYKVLAEIEPAGKVVPREARVEEQESEAPAFDPSIQVTMYCTSWCPACRRARNYLKANRIQFSEIDIGKDRQAAARVKEWADGNETTPTFEIGDTVVVNFNRSKLDKIFGFE